MQVRVSFYSWFKDLTGCAETQQEIAPGSTLAQLRADLGRKFPKFAAAQKSTLMAVGVDYQDPAYLLKEGDEVSFFPPVQGG
jgi:molybdopterin converting factor small subunit